MEEESKSVESGSKRGSLERRKMRNQQKEGFDTSMNFAGGKPKKSLAKKGGKKKRMNNPSNFYGR